MLGIEKTAQHIAVPFGVFVDKGLIARKLLCFVSVNFLVLLLFHSPYNYRTK